jgi:hypothetical protein
MSVSPPHPSTKAFTCVTRYTDSMFANFTDNSDDWNRAVVG